jgi:hypothetical protein
MSDYQSSKFNLQTQSIAGRREWLYEDTGPIGDVVASGFVTDGSKKGAKANDAVRYLDTSRGIWYGLRVSNVSDTGATQLTLDGQVIIGDTS